MKSKFTKIWLICISLVILASLILPSVLADSSFNVVDVFLSKKDCTAPPSPDANLFTCATKATSFKVGEQVWHCVNIKNTLGGGVAANINFFLDNKLKKTNSVPGYPFFYITRCDYYKQYTNSDAGTHIFKGEAFPCIEEGSCSKSTIFEIKPLIKIIKKPKIILQKMKWGE